jgi:hypothetical protein
MFASPRSCRHACKHDTHPRACIGGYFGARTRSSHNRIPFVDPRVADRQPSVRGVGNEVREVLTGANLGGMPRGMAALKELWDLITVHFLIHGESGQVVLAIAAISNAALRVDTGELALWGGHFATNADIAVWWRAVDERSIGLVFVDNVRASTAAPGKRSTDAIVAAQLCRERTLKPTTGVLALGALIRVAITAAYQDVSTAAPTVSFDPLTVPGNGLFCSIFTETLAFPGTVANAGFASIIDLDVPKVLAQITSLLATVVQGEFSSGARPAMTSHSHVPDNADLLRVITTRDFLSSVVRI